MTAPQVADEVLTYYSTHFDEHTRLDASAAGVLELVRTQELLRPLRTTWCCCSGRCTT
ncbi:hypothetical protein ACIRO1_19915 [Streptomyces sp. NPDC102381]|uniref:hypothetical protein n=1 Tax=Streptomyces sp. NPDC102381 TaxID=3366164 RepID=UPI00380AAA3A